MDVEISCFICGQPLANQQTIDVKRKGVSAFRKASEKRQDGKVELIGRKRNKITVHKVCSKNYTSESHISAWNRQNSPSQSVILPKKVYFPFTKRCFLCGDAIEIKAKGGKKNLNRKSIRVQIAVSNVTHPKFGNRILDIIKGRTDSESICIRERLDSIENLAAKKAKYHRACLFKIKIHSLKESKKSASEDDKSTPEQCINKVTAAMEEIFSYLDQHECECEIIVL